MVRVIGLRRFGMRGASASLALALALGTALAACGDVKDVNTSKTGGKAGKGNGAEGGEGATGNTGGSTGATGGSTGATGGDEPEGCTPNERGCADANTPQECNSKGEWVVEEKCPNATKVCTGKGECVAYRLLNSGIDSFGVRPAEGAIVLKAQTLSAAPRSCGNVPDEGMVCVTGGVR